MYRSYKHPLFIIPSLLLVVLLGISVVMEVDLDERQEEIVRIIGEPVSGYGHHLNQALWHFQKELQTNDAQILDTTAKLRSSLNEAENALSLIESFFHNREGEQHEHPSHLLLLNSLKDDLVKMRDLVDTCEMDLADCTPSLRKMSIKLITDVQAFNKEVTTDHDDVLHNVMQDILNNEFWREALLGVCLLILLGLVGFAFRMIRVYQNESERVKNSERRYALFAAIVQSSRIGVVVRDMLAPGTPVVFVNKAFTDITGYVLQDVESKNVGFLIGIHTDTGETEKLRAAFLKNESAISHVMLYRKDNTPFWSEWHICPMRQNDGRVSHYFSIITDVSTMQATQESLQLAKETAERAGTVKSNFLASMSHEIRTPINGVLGVLDLLLDTELDEEQKKLVRVATHSGRHLLDVVNDVLDYSKIEAGKLELEHHPFSLSNTLDEVISIVSPSAEAKKITLSFNIAADAPDHLLSDRSRIKQILLNLLANAIKFTETGSVTLKVIKLMDQMDQDHPLALLRFEIVDTGIGISVEDQERLFNEFSQVDRSFTRRFGGTGLGLAISKQLVRLLNGEIGVESHEGKGSRFWFMLPLEQARTAPVEEEDPPSYLVIDPSRHESSIAVKPRENDAPDNGLSILLAEDNAVNQLVALRYLRKAGFRPDLANNGVEAVKMVQEKAYCAVLMDVSMPEMDGLTATRKIRELGDAYTNLPIIAVTAHVMRGDRERCIASGMNDYLCKPLHFHSLCKVLARWVPDYVYDEEAMLAKETMKHATPSYDPRVLAQLAKDLDTTTVWNITDVFMMDSAKRIKKLTDHLTDGNMREASREAHAMKSSCAGCGLLAFSELMEKMERIGNNDDLEGLRALSQGMEKLYSQSIEQLNQDRMQYQPS